MVVIHATECTDAQYVLIYQITLDFLIEVSIQINNFVHIASLFSDHNMVLYF